MCVCDLWFVKDLYENGKLVPFNVWQNRGARATEYLVWRGIIQCVKNAYGIIDVNDIPKECHVVCGIQCNDKFMSIVDVNQKFIKNMLRWVRYEKCNQLLKSQIKYHEKCVLIEEEWQNIYMLAKEIIVDNKTIEMQFKILHRIIGTNSFLYKIGKSISPSCHHCEMFTENIEQILFECIFVKNFWLKVSER